MTCNRLGIVAPYGMSLVGRLFRGEDPRQFEEALHTPSEGLYH